jgi:hypothetical protein
VRRPRPDPGAISPRSSTGAVGRSRPALPMAERSHAITELAAETGQAATPARVAEHNNLISSGQEGPGKIVNHPGLARLRSGSRPTPVRSRIGPAPRPQPGLPSRPGPTRPMGPPVHSLRPLPPPQVSPTPPLTASSLPASAQTPPEKPAIHPGEPPPMRALIGDVRPCALYAVTASAPRPTLSAEADW